MIREFRSFIKKVIPGLVTSLHPSSQMLFKNTLSTHELWNNYSGFLTQHFWKEYTFRSESYFMCSIGEADPDTIRKYIENQG